MTADEKRREGPHIGTLPLPYPPSSAICLLLFPTLFYPDHCLEYWREAAMCRGDTTLSTFRWADGKPFSTRYSDHECVNWEMLDEWARGRMVDMSDYGILDLGKSSYPE